LLSPYGFPDSFTFLSPVLLNSLRFLMNPSAGLGLAVLLRLAGSPLGCPTAAPQDVPDDERRDQYHHRDQRVVGVGGDVVVDRVDVIAGRIADGHPGPHPQRGTDGVEEQETPPVHTADAGDDSVRLAQALDEPRNHDDLAAVPVEKNLSPV
jgi:hypothetical protein